MGIILRTPSLKVFRMHKSFTEHDMLQISLLELCPRGKTLLKTVVGKQKETQRKKLLKGGKNNRTQSTRSKRDNCANMLETQETESQLLLAEGKSERRTVPVRLDVLLDAAARGRGKRSEEKKKGSTEYPLKKVRV